MDASLREIHKFEARIGLPNGFFLELLNESDWGFVIKLHSLFEGVATRILSLRLGDGKIESALSYLDFAHPKYGKVRLLRDLGILNIDQYNFLRLLSELRNLLVHRIENVTFTFSAYLQILDENQRKSFFNRVGYNTNDPIHIAGHTVSRDQFIRENTRFSMWLTASDALACICLEEELVNLEEGRKKVELERISLAGKVLDLQKIISDIVGMPK